MTKGIFNNVNQETSQASTSGNVNVLGNVSEPATVTVNGTNAVVSISSALGTNNHFQTSLALSQGTNSLTIIAKDYSNNTKTNTFSVNIASGSARTITFDANGNLTNMLSGTVNTAYSWDAADRLVGISTNGVQVVAFAYNGLNQRTRMIQTSGATATTNVLLWCDGAQPCELRGADGGTVLKRYLPQGEQHGTTNLFYTFDHLGSVREVVDSSGTNVVARMNYDPWGRQTQVSGSIQPDFGFQGMYVLRNSGETYPINLTWYRPYIPDLGIFPVRDPLGLRGGLNPYTAFGNNAINNIDPLGLFNVVGHNIILNRAFGATAPNADQLSKSEVSILQAASKRIDEDQGTESSYRHAMRAPGQSVEEAQRLYNQFVEDRLQKAACEERQGHHNKALDILGEGMHALSDSVSPAHEGFQEWQGMGSPSQDAAAANHARKELWPTEQQKQRTDTLLRNYYDRFNSLSHP